MRSAMAGSRIYCCKRYLERVIEEYPHDKYQTALDRLSRMPSADPRINTDRIAAFAEISARWKRRLQHLL